MTERIVPRATYRLQLRPGFGFREVAELTPYLQSLGVSHAYLSPHLQAVSGSAHGYDVVDHTHVNSELGGEEAHEAMCQALSQAGIGIVVDIVPNHMAISSEHNRWWWDILENGRASVYADYFDVDWRRLEEMQNDRVLLPILGDHYGRELAKGRIGLERRDGDFVILVYDRALPLAPLSLPEILERASTRTDSDELAFFADALRRLPAPTSTDPTEVRLRHRDKAVIGQMLTRLFREVPRLAEGVDGVLAEIRADPGQLDVLLEKQNYRLAHWRTARHDLGYRRFFDVSELAALRVEDPAVLRDTHELIFRWVREGRVHGLRIDHPDGLRDPEAYFETLRKTAPDAWIVVEKILERGETLPASWPVDGTTGYDFMRFVTGINVDPTGVEALGNLRERFSGEVFVDWESFVVDKKRRVASELLSSELERLSAFGRRMCSRHRESRDFTQADIRLALTEIAAHMPVYRTYLRAGGAMSSGDKQLLRHAASRVTGERPDVDPELLSLLVSVLSGERDGPLERELAFRFQQLTGPLMAKGVEDTSFYCWGRLLGALEVGHDPGEPAVSLSEFHTECQRRARELPISMLASSTHDTKRSADVRARLCLLSECADFWGETLDALRPHLETHAADELDRLTILYFFESWIGASPIDPERMALYMLKAVREAKTHTSWARPDERYEGALEAFCRACMADAKSPTGDRTLRRLAQPRVARLGAFAKAAHPDGAGRAGHLSRRRALGPQPHRSRQSACRRLRSAPSSAHGSTRDGDSTRAKPRRGRKASIDRPRARCSEEKGRAFPGLFPPVGAG